MYYGIYYPCTETYYIVGHFVIKLTGCYIQDVIVSGNENSINIF